VRKIGRSCTDQALAVSDSNTLSPELGVTHFIGNIPDNKIISSTIGELKEKYTCANKRLVLTPVWAKTHTGRPRFENIRQMSVQALEAL
jgi:hypothetical protein